MKIDPTTGFRSIEPTPDPQTLRKLYQRSFYEKDKPDYLAKMHDERPYWHAIWAIRLSLMAHQLGDGRRMLDIGAGGGFFLDCARAHGWQVYGIEPSRQSCVYARDSFSLDLFEGFLEDYAPHTLFDAIHLSLVLEHVADPRAFLQKAMSCLRSGGVIWIETPNDFNPLQSVICDQQSKPEWWVAPQHHLNYFDYDSLQALTSEMGGRVVDRLGSFPMELFVLCGIDYLSNPEQGAQAHRMRMSFESQVCATSPSTLIELARAFAQAKVGRTCSILAIKDP